MTNMLRQYDETKFLASMYVLTIAIFNFMSGLFFITADPRIASPTYDKLSELVPLSVYGLLMLASPVLLCTAIFTVGRLRSIFMRLGGLPRAFSTGLCASSSSLGAVNLMLPARYSLTS